MNIISISFVNVIFCSAYHRINFIRIVDGLGLRLPCPRSNRILMNDLNIVDLSEVIGRVHPSRTGACASETVAMEINAI